MYLLPAQNKKQLPCAKILSKRFISKGGVANGGSLASRSDETIQLLPSFKNQERAPGNHNGSNQTVWALTKLSTLADWPIIDFTTLSQAEKIELDLSYEFLKIHKCDGQYLI